MTNKQHLAVGQLIIGACSPASDKCNVLGHQDAWYAVEVTYDIFKAINGMILFSKYFRYGRLGKHFRQSCAIFQNDRRDFAKYSNPITPLPVALHIRMYYFWPLPLQWRHNGCDGFSNHQPHDCLLNRLFRCRSKKTSKLRVTGLCAGNSPVTGEFPAQMASKAENISIWWRHHALSVTVCSQWSQTTTRNNHRRQSRGLVFLSARKKL